MKKIPAGEARGERYLGGDRERQRGVVKHARGTPGARRAN